MGIQTQEMGGFLELGKAMMAVRQEMLAAVEESITSKESGWSVADPAKAAEYVVNMLTVWRTDLLRRAAEVYGDPPPTTGAAMSTDGEGANDEAG